MGNKKKDETKFVPADKSSLVCDDPQKAMQVLFLRMFPSLRCHDRSSEDYAKEFIREHRDMIRRSAEKYEVPVLLLAGILYNEMTWSRLGARGADMTSYYIQARLFHKKSASIGPGSVQASHVVEWYKEKNIELPLSDAAGKLYRDVEFSIDSSARVLSESYHALKKTRLYDNSLLPQGFSAKSTFTVDINSDEALLWSQVVGKYNKGYDYQRAVNYSISVISDIFR